MLCSSHCWDGWKLSSGGSAEFLEKQEAVANMSKNSSQKELEAKLELL
jgi:hypothetical protein